MVGRECDLQQNGKILEIDRKWARVEAINIMSSLSFQLINSCATKQEAVLPCQDVSRDSFNQDAARSAGIAHLIRIDYSVIVLIELKLNIGYLVIACMIDQNWAVKYPLRSK